MSSTSVPRPVATPVVFAPPAERLLEPRPGTSALREPAPVPA